MADQIETGSSVLLARILATLQRLWQDESREPATRFSFPTGELTAGHDFVATVFPVTAAWTRFANQNPHRFALMVSQPIGTTCFIWPNGEAGASGGLSVPSNGWDIIKRTDHGSLVNSDWYVKNAAGAGTFSFIEVF